MLLNHKPKKKGVLKPILVEQDLDPKQFNNDDSSSNLIYLKNSTTKIRKTVKLD
jgi:hypothetical protein